MKLRKNLILLIAGALVTGACSSTSTMISSSWRKPDASASGFRTLFIAAMTSNIPAKQAVETGLQNKLQEKGLTVVKSMDVFPPTFSNQTGAQRELVLNKIQETQADGIVTIALLKKESENRYVGGGPVWNPGLRFGYYNRFWNYYSNWHPYLYNPGYYDETDVYYLETNLYNAKTEELIWAAQSETYDPSSINDFLKGYVKSIYERMQKDGLISENAQ
jgi:pectate lyase